MSDFVDVHPGWNVWSVYQVKDLPFSVLMVGVSRDRQLRLWVEDAIRLGSSGPIVADPADLKGGQIEILPAEPAGLAVAQRKEAVGGNALVVDGPADLRYVRFYNRGAPGSVSWPHDSSYLLNEVFTPDPKNAATSGPGPSTIGQTVGGGVAEVAKDAGVGTLASGIVVVAVGILGFQFLLNRKR